MDLPLRNLEERAHCGTGDKCFVQTCSLLLSNRRLIEGHLQNRFSLGNAHSQYLLLHNKFWTLSPVLSEQYGGVGGGRLVVCTLDSSSHFGSLDIKKNKYSWPWNYHMCTVISHLFIIFFWNKPYDENGKMPKPHKLLLKLISLLKWQSARKLISANQEKEDDIFVTLVVWGTTIGSWCITPTDAC